MIQVPESTWGLCRRMFTFCSNDVKYKFLILLIYILSPNGIYYLDDLCINIDLFRLNRKRCNFGKGLSFRERKQSFQSVISIIDGSCN
jgi:hypothetical protein